MQDRLPNELSPPCTFCRPLRSKDPQAVIKEGETQPNGRLLRQRVDRKRQQAYLVSDYRAIINAR